MGDLGSDERRQLMDDFAEWLRRDPTGAVLAGVIQQDVTQGDVRVDIAMADFDVRHLLIVAYSLLMKAEERVLADYDDEVVRGLLPVIQRALAAIGNTDAPSN
jgi:hypothetical protein